MLSHAAYAANISHLRQKEGKSRQEIRKICEEPFFRYLKDPNYYNQSSFLSIAKELLTCLKEGYINKLVVVSASNGTRKNEKEERSMVT